MSDRVSFPRQSARTQRFTLGRPRSFTVAADGSRVVFLRSHGGTDPVTCLWTFDVASAAERLVADPRALDAAGDDLPPEERARRERAREGAGGIVSYATDPLCQVAAFALGGRAYLADLEAGEVASLATSGPVFDPRPDPTGTRVAYASQRQLRVVDVDGADRALCRDDDADVSWGQAEFIAAEEMGRERGFWWSPDGARLAVARVDITRVCRWHIANPADPGRPPHEVAYPAAGTDNADVRLFLIDLDGGRTAVTWDGDAFPYLARAVWRGRRPLTLSVQARDQRRMLVLTVDDDGATTVVHEQSDPQWLDIVGGVPDWLDDGRLVTTVDDRSTRRLAIAGEPVTPPRLQVHSVIDVGSNVVFVGSTDAGESHLFRVDGEGHLQRLTDAPGVHGGRAGADVAVVVSSSLERTGGRVVVRKDGHEVGELSWLAEEPPIQPRVTLLHVGARQLNAALLLPSHGIAGQKLPVLLDPYGGPHSARVVKAADAYLSSQWFADQGFAVLVVDGRGTPGRGRRWEKEVHGDLAQPVLEDQIDALHAVAADHPELDLGRVAIRGWSFGGYLAALAVLRRPDVFHAAVAGAPVTDWRLYDTHYTERYLGHPDDDPEAYRRTSLLEDAHCLERPLLLIHGLADDNVVVAHTLQLSRALLEAGRPHSVLPLSGVTHMTPQEVVAENLLLLQVAFLRQALGL